MLKPIAFIFFMLFVATVLPAGYQYFLHQARYAGAAPPGKVRKRLRRAWLFLVLFLVTLAVKVILPLSGENREAPAVPVDRPTVDAPSGPVSSEPPSEAVADDGKEDDDGGKKKSHKKRGDD